MENEIAAFAGYGIRINRPQTAVIAKHIISLTVPGIRSETLLHSLSADGVYVSSGSACSSNTGHASYVLRSFGLSAADADSTIRISLGTQNTEEDIAAFCVSLDRGLQKLAKTNDFQDTGFKMTPEIYLTKSTEETEMLGFEFSKALNAGDFVAMFGDLGVGKQRSSAVRHTISHRARESKVRLIRS